MQLAEARERLDAAEREIRALNARLAVQAEAAERARAQAEEAGAARSALLAGLSHELCTPLNAIGGYVDLLDLEIHGPITAQQREDLGRIRRNQQHLLAMINGIHDFARIEAGRVSYRIEAVPVNETLAAMEGRIAPQVAARGVIYGYRSGDPDPTVHADRERLEQIVLGLLTNAVKFTDRGGQVLLSWSAGEQEVRIEVADTGRGIPAEQLETVFEPFVKVGPRPATPDGAGVGLGLATGRRLARAMGGELSARSRPGVGSVFTLTLPRAGVSPAS